MADGLLKMHSTIEQWLATGFRGRVTVLREQAEHLACRIVDTSANMYCLATEEALTPGETVCLSSMNLPGDRRLIAKVRQCMASQDGYFVGLEAVEDRLGKLDSLALRSLFGCAPTDTVRPRQKVTLASFGLAAASLLVTTGLFLSVSGLMGRASAGERVFVPVSRQDATPDVPEPPPLALAPSGLSIRATGLSWVTACADGKKLFERLFQPGDTAAIPFSEAAIVRSGNAGGLEVTLGDKSLGLMGEWGAIRMLRATPQGYDYVSPVLSDTCIPQ